MKEHLIFLPLIIAILADKVNIGVIRKVIIRKAKRKQR